MSSESVVPPLIDEFSAAVSNFAGSSLGRYAGASSSIGELKMAHGALEGLDTQAIRAAGAVAAHGGKANNGPGAGSSTESSNHDLAKRIDPIAIIIDLSVNMAGTMLSDFFSREDKGFQDERRGAEDIQQQTDHCCDAVDVIVKDSEIGLTEILLAATPVVHVLSLFLRATPVGVLSNVLLTAGVSIIENTLSSSLSTCKDRDTMVTSCFNAYLDRCLEHCAQQESSPPAPAPHPAAHREPPPPVPEPHPCDSGSSSHAAGGTSMHCSSAVPTVTASAQSSVFSSDAGNLQTVVASAGPPAPPLMGPPVNPPLASPVSTAAAIAGSFVASTNAGLAEQVVQLSSGSSALPTSLDGVVSSIADDLEACITHAAGCMEDESFRGILGAVGAGVVSVGAAALVGCLSQAVMDCEVDAGEYNPPVPIPDSPSEPMQGPEPEAEPAPQVESPQPVPPPQPKPGLEPDSVPDPAPQLDPGPGDVYTPPPELAEVAEPTPPPKKVAVYGGITVAAEAAHAVETNAPAPHPLPEKPHGPPPVEPPSNPARKAGSW